MPKFNPDLLIIALIVLAMTSWLFVTPLLAFFISLSTLLLMTIALALGLGLFYGLILLAFRVAMLWQQWQSSRLELRQVELKTMSMYHKMEQEAAKVQQELVKIQQLNVKVQREQAKLMCTVQQVIKPGHRLVIGGPNGLQLLDGNPSRTDAPPCVSANMPNIVKATDDALSYSTGEQWIKDFLFHPDGGLKIHHVSVNGPTRSGKTWLLLHLMWLMQQPHPEAEYYLIDPKYEGPSSGWPFPPMVTDFDDVPEAVNYIYEHVVKARKTAKQQSQPILHPAFVCIDEFDGCSSEHKEKFIKPVSRGVKEGASGDTHYMAVGQSTLIGDIGGSGALYRNMARIIMGTEGLAFINNPQFVYRGMKGHKQKWERQLFYLQEHGRRYGLIVPPSNQGLPFVAEIPILPKPLFKAYTDLTPSLSYVGEGENLPPDVGGIEGGRNNLTRTNPPPDVGGNEGGRNNLTPTLSYIGEGDKPLTPEELQLQADLAVVRANMDKLQYHKRKGTILPLSVAIILGFHYGPEMPRADRVTKVLNEEL